MESAASVLGEVATCVKSADEPMGAASREAKPVADLRDPETLRLGGEELEDVERSLSRFDRLRLGSGAVGVLHVASRQSPGGKSSNSQTMIVTPPVAKLGTSAIASSIS